MTHEVRNYIRREIDRIRRLEFADSNGVIHTNGRPAMKDPETEGRAAFAAIGQPWPGDTVAVAAA